MKKIIKRQVFFGLLVGVLWMTQSCNESALDKSILKDASNPVVKVETTAGDVFIELYKKEAPLSVENFLAYVEKGFYEGTVFHRVIKGFMIQGGGFKPGMEEKPTMEPIRNEAVNGLKNARGTLSYARTQIVDSATSQFFVNLVDNTFLDHKSTAAHEFGYAVFGHVVEGLHIVDAIGDVETHSVPPYDDVPASDVVIDRVVVIQ